VLSEARLLSALATLRDVLTPGEALNVPAVLDRSALLDVLSVLTTDPATTTPVPVPNRPTVIAHPPRWNFAGFCLMCGVQMCESTECATLWAQTTWSMCINCQGSGADTLTYDICDCYGGLTQDDDNPVRVGWLVQDDPIIARPPLARAIDDAAELW
jgi:hypothetical protein